MSERSSSEMAQLRSGLHHLLASNIPECVDGAWEGNMLRSDKLSRLIDAVVAMVRPRSAAQAGTDPVAAERARCIAICEGWIGTFQDKEIQYTTAREYAVDAIEDIIDLIRDGHTVAVSSTPRECGLCGGPLPCLTHSQGLAVSSTDRQRSSGT